VQGIDISGLQPFCYSDAGFLGLCSRLIYCSIFGAILEEKAIAMAKRDPETRWRNPMAILIPVPIAKLDADLWGWFAASLYGSLVSRDA